MAVPFSIGKILDSATQPDGIVFGLKLEYFVGAMAALLMTGRHTVARSFKMKTAETVHVF